MRSHGLRLKDIGLASLVLLTGIGCTSSDSPRGEAAPGSIIGSAPLCTGEPTTTADVDDDNQADRVFWEYIEGQGPRLVVCTAEGNESVIHATGMGELLYIGDVEPDGREEIFYGGTSVSASFLSIAVFADGALRPVGVEGEELELIQGLVFGVGELGSGQAWGCEDTDEDGSREIVRVIVKPEGDILRWTREVYRLEGSTAGLLSTQSGSVREQEDRAAEVADSLTSPCELREGT